MASFIFYKRTKGVIASMKAARLVGPKLFEFLDADMPVANDGQV